MPKIALRMRLYPTEAQTHVLNRYIGAARAVHNLMLEYLEGTRKFSSEGKFFSRTIF